MKEVKELTLQVSRKNILSGCSTVEKMQGLIKVTLENTKQLNLHFQQMQESQVG